MYQKLCKDLEILKNKVNTDDITPDLIQLLVSRKSERAGQKKLCTQMVLCSDWVQGTLPDSTKQGIGGTPLVLHHMSREDTRTSFFLTAPLPEGTLTFSSCEQFCRCFPPEGILLLSAWWSSSWEVLQGSILTLSRDPAPPCVLIPALPLYPVAARKHRTPWALLSQS